jgi:hypothetical protein
VRAKGRDTTSSGKRVDEGDGSETEGLRASGEHGPTTDMDRGKR